VVESLGQLGILFLMFLAGLELDLDEFQANRRAALTFGAFTFTIPFVLGVALVLPFGYGAATAMASDSRPSVLLLEVVHRAGGTRDPSAPHCSPGVRLFYRDVFSDLSVRRSSSSSGFLSRRLQQRSRL